MKLYYILLFLFLPSLAFGNYIKEADFNDGEPFTVYSSEKACGDGCLRFVPGCRASFCEKKEILMRDIPNGTATKNESEDCSAVADDPGTTEVDETRTEEENCQDRLAAKFSAGCADPEESPIMRLDTSPKQVYCSKMVYPMIGSGVFYIAEDAALKVSHDSAQAAAKAQRDAIQTRLKDMNFGKELYAAVQVMNKAKGLSKAQRRQLRQDLKTIRDDLADGNICEAREDIAAITPDGTLITAADITAVLAKIDAERTCP